MLGAILRLTTIIFRDEKEEMTKNANCLVLWYFISCKQIVTVIQRGK